MQARTPTWRLKIVQRKADTVLNYVLPMEEHPSGTTRQLFLMDAPSWEGRNSKLCMLTSATFSMGSNIFLLSFFESNLLTLMPLLQMQAWTPTWRLKIVQRKADTVLNYVLPVEEHPSGTTGQSLRRESSVNAQTFTEKSYQKSQIISQ